VVTSGLQVAQRSRLQAQGGPLVSSAPAADDQQPSGEQPEALHICTIKLG